MSKKQTVIQWIFKWVLTSLFGMMWTSGKWFQRFKGSSLSGVESGGSLIQVKGRGGSITEIQTTGDASSHGVSLAPGTSVEIKNKSGSLPPEVTVSMILVFLTLYMSVGVYLYILRPGLFPRSSFRLTTFEKINQFVLIVLLIAYVINLIVLFIGRYIVNKQSGMDPVLNIIFIMVFLALTLAYIFWGMGELAETRMRIYFPVSLFSPL